jgi:hypothetical protein
MNAGIASLRIMGTSLAVAGLAQMSAWGQAIDPPGEYLADMEGKWQGSGWIVTPAGERQTFDVFEEAILAAGGHAVIVMGEGFAPQGAGREGRQVHDAAGLISRVDDGYQMRAVTAEGRMQDVPLVFTEDGFDWSLDLGPHGRVVYSTTLAGDVWTETGFYCPLEGECRQTFYMRIERM